MSKKERFYFSHDFHSRNDRELMKVRMALGMAGVGTYWCIVEMLHEEKGYLLRSDYERIAFELRVEILSITTLVEDYDLFKFDDEKFWSESALSRIEQRNEKSASASKSVQIRWEKERAKNEGNTVVQKRNTIKERKGNVFT